MKNAMSWFDINFETKTDNKIDEVLLRLFDLMKKSLHIYFNIGNSSDIHEFLKIVATKNNVDHSFIEWIKVKGIPRLKSIDFENLPSNDQFLAMIEIDEYCLKSEMDFKEPEEVRGWIITIINSIQEYANICKQLEVVQ
ncbi:hypothetical protein LSG23_09580 [Bacillus velezensis]|uniref:hypothetical protein n=1 Tax=Bacillus amyloliquefaciens group TaxID=1938374 RepID=UPI00098A9C2F|nr:MULTISPECIES: hypothetical protein [Bacillus amyloliquefaciens group]MCX4184164.1 hypothetical protein [Bacillus amyloliquefaciens]WNR79389.1 hypothetical protein RP314_10750 [Bacillus velezensis]